MKKIFKKVKNISRQSFKDNDLGLISSLENIINNAISKNNSQDILFDEYCLKNFGTNEFYDNLFILGCKGHTCF